MYDTAQQSTEFNSPMFQGNKGTITGGESLT